MRIQMEPTEHLVEMDGVKARVWNGVTEGGTQVFVFVHRLAVRDGDELGQLERELLECAGPRVLSKEGA